MILKNRLFERETPSREAKSIYIFCEGAKREYQYFRYFKEIDSRINVEIYMLQHDEDNSPLGLLNIAKACIFKTDSNPNPKYSFQKGDEVWIVLDTDKDKNDSRKPQIKEIRQECNKNNNWFVAQSNPCFEVWLYYHFFDNKPIFTGNDMCSNWKQYLNKEIPGSFDSRKHPVFISKATSNAKKNYDVIDNESPDIGCTEVFKLSNSIYPLIEKKITQALKNVSM